MVNETIDLFLAALLTHPTDCSRSSWGKNSRKMASLRAIKPNLAWFGYCIELVLYEGEITLRLNPSSKIEPEVTSLKARRSKKLSHYSGVLVGMGAWVSNLEIVQILHPKI